MPTLARYFFYAFLAVIGFMIGRYLLPGTSKLANSEQVSTWDTEAQQRFWSKRAAPLLSSELTPAAKLEQGRMLLDHLQIGHFPAVHRALSGDPTLAALVAEAWARADAPGFFKELAAGAPADLKAACILIATWAQRDFPAAEAAASRLRVPGQQPDPVKAVAVAWLRKDVPRGLQFLQQNKLSLPKDVMLTELQVTQAESPRWQKLDENARLDLLQTQPLSAWREAALQQCFSARLAREPESVLVEAQESGRGMNLVTTAARNWLERDPTAVATFFEKTARHQVRALLGTVMAHEMALADPTAAWEFAVTQLTGQPRCEALEFIVAQVASQNPSAAARALADTTDAPWRIRALAALQTSWTGKDATAAQAWLHTLPARDQTALRLLTAKPSE